MHPYRILRGPLRGRVIVTSLHDYPGAILGRTEGPLLAWFERNVRLGETWLDIGAHYGYTAIALAELVGPNGLVYAFEPSVVTAGHLSRTRTLNRMPQIKVVPLALADEGKLRSASVAVDRGMANHLFGGTAVDDILLMGFDEYWRSIASPRIDGVKIDVQGMEAEVLRGMCVALTTEKPKLVLEFHHGVDRSAILQMLSGFGYALPGVPIAPLKGEAEATYHDDRSYSFIRAD